VNAKYEDIYGSEYLSPPDIPADKTIKVTFIACDVRELYCNGQKNVRCVMTVDGAKKKVAINKTSAKVLAKAWGKEFSDWLNKPVIIRRGQVNRREAILVSPAEIKSE